MARPITPLLWLLFSAGGTVAALLFPVHLFLNGLAFPLGWLPAPRYESLRSLVGHPLTRLYLLVLVSLPLFHWAHRFRYTLYDGLQKLSFATGKRIRYVNVAPEEAKRAQLAAGVPPYTADALAELFAERRKGKEAQVSPIIQTIFGLRATSFGEFATRNAAIFRGEQPAPKV